MILRIMIIKWFATQLRMEIEPDVVVGVGMNGGKGNVMLYAEYLLVGFL